MRPERVIIVGAGIGGMALAAALQRLGIPVLVLERAAHLGEVGAGLGVLPNAVRALAAIGDLAHALRRRRPLPTVSDLQPAWRGARRDRLRGCLPAGGRRGIRHASRGAPRRDLGVRRSGLRPTGRACHVDRAERRRRLGPCRGRVGAGSRGSRRRGRRPQLGRAGIRPRQMVHRGTRARRSSVESRRAISTRPTSAAKCWARGSGPPSTTWEAAAATGGRPVPFHPAPTSPRKPGAPICRSDSRDGPSVSRRSSRVRPRSASCRTTSSTGTRPGRGTAGGSCCSATRPIPRRPIWARARASRSRMPSCWLARSARPATGRARWRTITANAGRALPGSRGCRAGGAARDCGRPPRSCGSATRPIDRHLPRGSSGGCVISTATMQARWQRRVDHVDLRRSPCCCMRHTSRSMRS